MAVEDKYVLTTAQTEGKKSTPAKLTGDTTVTFTAIIELDGTESANSVLRFANLNSDLIPVTLTVNNDAITGHTDSNFGLYKPDAGGAAVDDNALADAISFASARAQGSEGTLLSAVAIEDSQKTLWELAGQTEAEHDASFDLAMTLVTPGSNAGTIVIKGTFVQG